MKDYRKAKAQLKKMIVKGTEESKGQQKYQGENRETSK